MTATLNGIDVVAAWVDMPERGPWCAWVDIDSDTAPTGRCVLQLDDGTAFRGTARTDEGGVFEGRARVHLVAGNGGLRATLTPRHYTSTLEAASVLADIATETGEAIDSSVDLASAEFEMWARPAMSGLDAVGQVARALGLSWRVLGGGTIWMGTPRWPAMALSESVLLEDDHGSGVLTLADATALRPGVIAYGQRITSVTHTMGAEGWRTEARYARSLQQDWRDAVRAAIPELAYLKEYDATVREQNSDGTLNVTCDDADVGPLGNLKIRCGLPNVSVTVEAETRCVVRFRNAVPYVCAFDEGADGAWTRINLGTLRIRSTQTPAPASFLEWVDPEGGYTPSATPIDGLTPASEGNLDVDLWGIINEREL